MDAARARSTDRVERYLASAVLGLAASGYLAVAGSGYLDPVTVAGMGAALAARGLWIAGLLRVRIPDRLLVALTLAYLGFYPLDYLYVSRDFLQATVHLVFFLTAARILTARTRRDHFYSGVLAFLQLLAAALVSNHPGFFVFLGLFLLFAIAAFTSAEIHRSMGRPWRVARSGLAWFQWRLAALAVIISVGILWLTAGLFFLLPRTAGAAFRRMAAEREHLPGFSNRVNLGAIGRIKARSNPVMHVRFYDRGGGPQLKWRGGALVDFDGRTWSNPAEPGQVVPLVGGRAVLASDDQRRRVGKRVVYLVNVRAMDSDALFFAGAPEVLNLNAPSIVRTPEDSYRLGTGFNYGVQYEVFASLGEPGLRAGAKLPADARRRSLRLPDVDPQVAALARKVTAGLGSDEARARALESFLRTAYGYTLDLPDEETSDPVADFLFRRRQGHCEYFASAMVVMLRSIGIPARMATGFQGGVLNPISGLQVVRASDAHSWVEAWLPEKGWSSFDPTPPDPNPAPESLWTRFSLYVDAADTFWQEWVMGYDLGRQLSLAERVERSGRRFGLEWTSRLGVSVSQAGDRIEAWIIRYRVALLAGIVLIVLGVRFGPGILRRVKVHRRVKQLRMGQGMVSDATLLYDRMLALLRQRGFEKPSWYTAAEFAKSLPASELALLVGRFTTAYHELRFGGRLDSASELPALLDRMERVRR
ncbi:MAG: DUF3488 domain-containing protein [Bryobacterales bacterium]|nr:DUF3488 domain-containing protein [Bryobacterales bacterium]